MTLDNQTLMPRPWNLTSEDYISVVISTLSGTNRPLTNFIDDLRNVRSFVPSLIKHIGIWLEVGEKVLMRLLNFMSLVKIGNFEGRRSILFTEGFEQSTCFCGTTVRTKHAVGEHHSFIFSLEVGSMQYVSVFML